MKTTVTFRNNVKIMGEGTETLLFGHGFGCDQNTWRSVIPAFLKEYKIVVFDYVGAGGSDLTAYDDERYSSLDGYANDIIDICTELQLHDVTFIGHSVSSMIGVLAIKMEPQFFKKIVFIGPSPMYMNEEGYKGGIDAGDLDDLLDVMDSNYLGWSRMVAPLIMGNEEKPDLAEALTASFCATDPEISKKFARVTFMSDNRKDLSSLTIPSLTIQCEEDFLTSREVAEYIQQHTANNTLIMLETKGHCPHLSDPKGVVSAMKGFI
ncbi:alpha/beta fold hydrolase [Pedobacter hartonius]|uniref:Sigma-B regulation protein RsbQ n=1 Tax=Pedobacter hartonius TaxID=425514 RepID=A0A1H3W2D5_9SPHI|nr:alpha/beta hydrolase [Pedobacter hartonius]SDZ80482.1 sigma-B regulation protein RsbQ [Pedobacter hartonius]